MSCGAPGRWRSAPTSCTTAATFSSTSASSRPCFSAACFRCRCSTRCSAPRSAVWIIYGAVKIARLSLTQLMDRELPDEERARVRAIAEGHPEVSAVHDIRTRVAGPTAFIQLHIEMDGAMNLLRAHEISDDVETQLRARLSARRDHHPRGPGRDRGAGHLPGPPHRAMIPGGRTAAAVAAVCRSGSLAVPDLIAARARLQRGLCVLRDARSAGSLYLSFTAAPG